MWKAILISVFAIGCSGSSQGDDIDPSQPGPEGPAGEMGLPGTQGPAGQQGAQGPVGPQGPQGVQGIQGIQGQQGAQGPAGVGLDPNSLYTRTAQVSLPGTNNSTAVAQALCDAGDMAISGGCWLTSDSYGQTGVRMVRQYTGPGMSLGAPATSICQAFCPSCSLSAGGATKLQADVVCIALP